MEQLFRDPCLRSGLEPMLRGQYETVRNIILAFAGNQRVAEADTSRDGTREVRPMRTLTNSFNESRADEPALNVGFPSNNDNGLQLLTSTAQQYPNHQLWTPFEMMGPIYTMPNLQQTHSRPSFSDRPSDSGLGTQQGSMVGEPQGRGMYQFGSMDIEDTTTLDEPAQPMPYYTQSVETSSTSLDIFWNTEQQQQ